jgi:uncharacterized secreted protein with C-terminal beta-propeller domain
MKMGKNAQSTLGLFAAVVVIGVFFILIYDGGDGIGPAEKEMQRFGSYDEMVTAFTEAQAAAKDAGGLLPRFMVTTTVLETIAGMPESQPDFSRTNIQVEGVDEADIVKTDGRYIYSFSKGMLAITHAYPAEDAGVVSMTELEGLYPLEMFIYDDSLLLFANKTGHAYADNREITADDREIAYRGVSEAVVRLYSTADRANPVLEKEVSFEGSYLSSRLIGSHAYFVINNWPVDIYAETGSEDSIIPLMREDGVERRVAEATEIGYVPPMPAESFVIIASLDFGTMELKTETIAGSAGNMFSSAENLYLASSFWQQPVLMARNIPMAEDIEGAVRMNEEKTVINKFRLENGEIRFEGQGSVPGTVLNQFSMDEYNGMFRIATTERPLWGISGQAENNVYVLDGEMETIGSLENLAPGETIYSARFMGERAYLVTFKKIDPFFVIDLSDPQNPAVLGKLKIPGYSDYLHPLDKDHIIGIGKEAIESGYGDFAWYQGLKMAIFDVSDVSNPVEMHRVVIGDRGTDSYALRDHKAFLYDRAKELLVIPVMLAEIEAGKKTSEWNEGRIPFFGTPVFQGAFAFRVTLENGFEEKARITHITEEDELKRGYFYGDEYSVKRSLYIDDVLYTISERMIKAHSLITFNELNAVVFG